MQLLPKHPTCRRLLNIQPAHTPLNQFQILRPYPTIKYFKDAWPEGLNEAVTARIRELLEPTHPHLVQRAEWAESLLVGTLPLKEQHLDLLSAAGIHSLFDMVRRTPEMLAERVKGFGIATAHQVHAKYMGLVKDWEQ
jgi:hypothetical protein